MARVRRKTHRQGRVQPADDAGGRVSFIPNMTPEPRVGSEHPEEAGRS